MARRNVEAVSRILSAECVDQMKNALAVGCGTGEEAATLARELNLDVTGIDVGDRFSEEARRHARLMLGDATALDFADASFDLVYCYHVLEHIPLPASAVLEMARVLRDGGLCWIGTPNRLRLAGYIGSDASCGEKVRWNLADWKSRARGSFRNEAGAHAGFSRDELRSLISRGFRGVKDMTRRYYDEVYGRHPVAVRLVAGTALGGVLLPSVYFLATKPVRGAEHEGRNGPTRARPA